MRLVLVATPLGYLLAHTRGEYALHFAPLIASGFTAIIASIWILSAVHKLPKTTPRAAESVALPV
jgi:hypothetical protein